MLRVNEYRLYYLGATLHPLSEIAEQVKLKQVLFQIIAARTALKSLLEDKNVPLKICTPVGLELIEILTSIVPIRIQDALNLDQESTVGNYFVYELRNKVREFETVLAAELQALDTYFVSQKGAYSTADLIERAEIVFPPSIRAKLPPKAIEEIRQAGRDLAFDSPTSAAFHTIRAMESVMSIYYNKTVGKQIPSRMRNWGVYIKVLQKTPSADQKIVSFLDHIREHYRNPITHPDVTFTSDEAEVFLGVAISAMVQMALTF